MASPGNACLKRLARDKCRIDEQVRLKAALLDQLGFVNLDHLMI